MSIPGDALRAIQCCDPVTGTYVTIEFSGVTIDEFPGAWFWYTCGVLNDTPFTVAAHVDDTSTGPCPIFVDENINTLELPFTVSAEGYSEDIGGGTSPFYDVNGITKLTITRCDDGWQITVWTAASMGGSRGAGTLSGAVCIFRGIAAHVGSGATSASNDAGGYTGVSPPDVGTIIGGGDFVFDIGTGGTATLTFGTTEPPSAGEAICLCEGIDRTTTCIDLVVIEVTDGGDVEYAIAIASAITPTTTVTETYAGGVPDYTTDPATFDPPEHFFVIGSAFATVADYKKTRTGCCDVTGTYTHPTDTRDVEVLLAANVEEANSHVYFEDEEEVVLFDKTFALIRNGAEFIGSDGLYVMRVWLDIVDDEPLWQMTVKIGATTYITASLTSPPWAESGTSFVGFYDVLTSIIDGVGDGGTIEVTT